MSIPTPDSVTPGWLTEQLQRAGHAGAVVESFSSERIGTGQIGQCHRYTLDYRAWNSSAPATLIGKFPSDDEQSRATAVALRNYYLEVCFYRELAGQLSIRTPHCYYADIVGEGPEFALLLEDLQPARQGDQLKGCSPAVAGRAVLELVGLQAPFWCDERLHDLAWLANSPDAVASGVQELYRQTLPGFRERYAGLLAPEQMAIFDALGESADPALFRAPERWFCLEHGDYRLDNMLIDERGDELAIAVVDWQTYRVGKPLNDVAYAIGAGLLPDDRRPAEESIVRAYHKALCEAGIDNLDWEECWKEYRQATLSGFPITVIASVMAGRTERGDAMFLAMADRHSRHALDHGAASFL